MTYYAVARGHKTGVFTDWNECKAATTGFKVGERVEGRGSEYILLLVGKLMIGGKEAGLRFHE